MICDVLLHPEALLSPTVLRPWGDTISKATWRKESLYELLHRRCNDHRFPEEGCHGAPLTKPCKHPRFSRDKTDWCPDCKGRGFVQCDAPNRTNIP
jgi:hypothetical protein